MNAYAVFAFEIGFCLFLSLAILWRLQEQLREVSRSLCEKGGLGADFWIAYFQLMVLIAPLAIVVFFSRAGHGYAAPVFMIQHSISLVLIAQFIGLALVGRAVWRAANPRKVLMPPAPAIAP